jgi:hypothetical protein
MPTYASQIDEMDFTTPGKVLWRIDSESRIGLREILSRYGLPPRVEIRHIDSDHEVLCERLIVEILKDEPRIAISETRIAIALPGLFKAQRPEKTSAGLVVFTAGTKGDNESTRSSFMRGTFSGQ